MLKLSMPSRTVVQYGLAAITTVLLLSWLRIRPLGLFFLSIFTLWFARTRCNLRIVPPPEFQSRCNDFAQRVCELRRTNPKMFCALATGCLAVLATLGHLLSGSTVVLLGLVLAAIVSTKYNFKLVKIDYKDFAWCEKLTHDADLDEEFMPEVNECALGVLQRASDLATLSTAAEDAADADEEEKSDEIPSELLIPDAIPEIDENYTDGDDDDDDLIPIITKQSNDNKNYAANKQYEDEIAFKRGHFKRDSSLSTTSSSDDECLSKGLKFPDHTMVDGATKSAAATNQLPSTSAAASSNAVASELVALAVKSQTQTLLANSGKLLPSLVSGLVQWGMGGAVVTAEKATSAAAAQQQRVVTALDSSDESDFEILENEDFK